MPARIDREYQLYAKAGELAKIAMGQTDEFHNKNRRWKADDDPLAWFLLTENIIELAKWFRNPTTYEGHAL